MEEFEDGEAWVKTADASWNEDNIKGYKQAKEDLRPWLQTAFDELEEKVREGVSGADVLENWNNGAEEGRRRERGFIVKLIDGNKQVYQLGECKWDKTRITEVDAGEEKAHLDSCCNETLDEILQTLTNKD